MFPYLREKIKVRQNAENTVRLVLRSETMLIKERHITKIPIRVVKTILQKTSHGMVSLAC